MCDALRRFTTSHRGPGHSLKSVTLSFPYCNSYDGIGSGVRIVASAIEELMAGGELSLTLKMVLASGSALDNDPWLELSAVNHLVTIVGTPQGMLWEQGNRWTRNHWETWAVLEPSREVEAGSMEQGSSVETESFTIKSFED